MIGWLGSILLIVGMLEVGHKRRSGFLYGAVGELFWVLRAFQTGQWDLIAICVVFVGVYVWNWLKWGFDEA